MIKIIRKQHYFMWDYLRALTKSFIRPTTLFLMILSSTLSAIYSTIFYFLEHGRNPQVGGFFDAFYFTCTTFTGVGFGDIHPITTLGKILAIIMMFSGTALFVSFTAVIATTLFEIETGFRGRSFKKGSDFRDHSHDEQPN